MLPLERRDEEPKPPIEGVKISFSNPELLRAYVLDHARIPPKNFAEQISGIRVATLGEFPLDGQLFEAMSISAVIERPYRSLKKHPTVILRADLRLGSDDSEIKKLQQKRVAVLEGDEEDDEFVRRIGIAFGKQSDPQQPVLDFLEWTRNIGLVHHRLTPETAEIEPLMVLQLWDTDVGPGSVSFSLVSFNRYSQAFMSQIKLFKGASDSWVFLSQVGVLASDEDQFQMALGLFEEAFPQILAAVYEIEGRKAPNLNYEVTPPMLLSDTGPVTFADIGGQHKAIEQLQGLGDLERANIQIEGMRRMALLAGPPGTGKSSLIQALATDYDMPLVRKTSLDIPPKVDQEVVKGLLESGYYEAKSAAKLHRGKAVYCIDGIEVFLGADGNLHDFLLNKMDLWNLDPEVFFMATTNFPEQLHPGIIRRFTSIPVPLPDRAGRQEILRIRSAKIAKMLGYDPFGQVDFEKLAQTLDKFSGADLANFLAVAYALRRAESQKAGRQLPIDTDYLLSLKTNRRIGFPTPT